MACGSLIWVDGEPSSALPLPDRGLDFGDGLFETLLLVDGQALYLPFHLQRLSRGLAVLGFPDCSDTVSSQLSGILRSQTFSGEAAIRVTVTRGSGPRGYCIPDQVSPRVIITISPRPDTNYRQVGAPAHLSLADIRWPTQSRLAGLKHLNRLEQVLAATECRAAGADEIVMLDQQGDVISVSAGNLFMLVDDTLLTPQLDLCGVSGTRRRLLIEQFGPAMGLAVREVKISLAQFETADEVFYCSTLAGFRPVASFGEHCWQRHDVCPAVHQNYCEGGR